jgi:hypothetical protein
MPAPLGLTAEEMREFVHEYEVQPYGQKVSWLSARGVSYDTLRRWRSAVFEGDLDRGLIPREGGPVTVPRASAGRWSGSGPRSAWRTRRRSLG